MSALTELKVQRRTDGGKGASRRLRRAGLVPGILYGGGKDPEMISITHHELTHEMEQEAFFSSVMSVNLDGKMQSVVLKDLQRHPARPFVLHVDFQRIKATEKIHMTVPLHFLNEEESDGLKQGGSALHALTDLDIVCLPRHLPEYIDIDMAGVDVGDVISVSDITLPEGVELESGVDLDARVASIVKIEEQVEEEILPEGEVPVEGEVPPDEEEEDEED